MQLHFAHFGTVGQKRCVGHAQKARSARVRVGGVPGLDRQADRRRYGRVDGPLELRENRAERGMSVLLAARTAGITAQAHVGIMLVGAAVERANDGELVHHLRKPRHVFADLDAGHVGRNRPERAADLGGELILRSYIS